MRIRTVVLLPLYINPPFLCRWMRLYSSTIVLTIHFNIANLWFAVPESVLPGLQLQSSLERKEAESLCVLIFWKEKMNKQLNVTHILQG